jgi:hypothetical protein
MSLERGERRRRQGDGHAVLAFGQETARTMSPVASVSVDADRVVRRTSGASRRVGVWPIAMPCLRTPASRSGRGSPQRPPSREVDLAVGDDEHVGLLEGRAASDVVLGALRRRRDVRAAGRRVRPRGPAACMSSPSRFGKWCSHMTAPLKQMTMASRFFLCMRRTKPTATAFASRLAKPAHGADPLRSMHSTPGPMSTFSLPASRTAAAIRR